ncbi:hypothetical protein GSI_08308 [Ganoderma sinense ZZ0214-1]|uniref:CxC1-like cysteine cluster associated with KDZ transposases domain-containing protein n=1 Tax=Ganoderma sinense ZZ0214-1 TaxID=1077348 RepID=A0A2G8S6U7_9APHY|nr:hypothetical protein GSI_08308 [Ganoderma sinense ZZ0214-1]
MRNQRFGIRDIVAERERAADRYKALTTGLGQQNRATLAAIRGEEPDLEDAAHATTEGTREHTTYVPDVEMQSLEDGSVPQDGDDEWEDVVEEESISYAIRDVLDAHTSVRVTRDTRTWAQRLRAVDENWKPKIPLLVAAYLRWKHPSAAPTGGESHAADTQSTQDLCASPEEPDILPSSTSSECPSPEAQQHDVPPSATSAFTIDVIDLYTGATSANIPVAGDQTAAEALVMAGYLGTTPVFPSLAVSLKTLELLRVIRLFKASFSIEAFAKMICYMYYIPYRRHYRTGLSDAFDIYLTIQQRVEQQIMAALGRETSDWRPIHGCPPCSYEVEGEKKPTWNRMLVLDGNNSLKRMATTGGRTVGDTRLFESDYFLARDYVNTFAKEVKSRQEQRKPDLPESDHDDSGDEGPSEQPDGGAYPTDSDAAKPAPCARHWKAAASDDSKRMWGMFDETGIFACACRHAMIVWLVDMVRSGELAKYPLAIVAKILDKIPGKKLIGYDIGCAFGDTVLHTSLKSAFEASGSRFCVNAFHGYSHSYDCQVQHHPNVIAGIGLEEMETLERIFSASNQLAPVIRYASTYRRLSFIHAFFRHWDSEKYANIGLFLYNNYVQALDIIEKHSEAVAATLRDLGITSEQLAEYDREERKYFVRLQDEDEANLWTIAYVEALQDLTKAREELEDTSARFRNRAPRDEDGDVRLTFLVPQSGATDYAGDLSATRRLERSRRVLLERVDRLTAEAIAIESEFHVRSRWQPGDEQYMKTLEYINNRRYYRALGKVQRLVIQRLFELHRLNLAQTGYKARTYLAKSLQRRCKAIRNAVTSYNAAAIQMNPPRAALDWDRVSHYTFLEEFPLLQETRNEVLEKPWTRPEVRALIRLSRRLERAHEEIQNANREVRRMHTWIRDEEVLFRQVGSKLQGESSVLYGAFVEFCKHRRAANARNLAYIQQIYGLKGFSGTVGAGRHVNGADRTGLPDPSAGAESQHVLRELTEGVGFHEEDGTAGEVSAIIDYLASLST